MSRKDNKNNSRRGRNPYALHAHFRKAGPMHDRRLARSGTRREELCRLLTEWDDDEDWLNLPEDGDAQAARSAPGAKKDQDGGAADGEDRGDDDDKVDEDKKRTEA